MSAQKFRRKPDEIEAIQFDGTNGDEVAEWCGGTVESAACYGDGPPYWVRFMSGDCSLVAGRNDWVVRTSDGLYYPCKTSALTDEYEVWS